VLKCVRTTWRWRYYGYKDAKQVHKYRQPLIDAGLLRLGAAYSTARFAKRHSLTQAAKKLLDAAKDTNGEAVG
jgi:hypothetical protein